MYEIERQDNLVAGEARQRLTTFLPGTPPFAGAEVRCVALKEGHGWINGMTVVRAYGEGERLDDAPSVRYPNALLLAQQIDGDSISSLFEQIEAGLFVVDGEEITIPAGSEQIRFKSIYRLPQGNSHFDRPGVMFIAPRTKPPQLSHAPLLDFERTFFDSTAEMISEWCRTKIDNPYGNDQVGGAVLFLPELRGCFGDWTVGEDAVQVQVKRHESCPRLRVKGAWYARTFRERVDVLVTEEEVSIPVPKGAERITAYLLTEHNEVLDGRQDQLWSLGAPAVVASKGEEPRELVEKALAHGEGPGVEFKPFVETDHDKVKQIVQTVIAFANTHGGTLVLGVDKNLQIVGIERELRPEARRGGGDQGALAEAANAYIGKLRTVVGDALERELLITWHQVEIDGHLLIAVIVPVGTQKPYMNVKNNENQIWVRRGSNNVKPNTDELALLFTAAQNLGSLGVNVSDDFL